MDPVQPPLDRLPRRLLDVWTTELPGIAPVERFLLRCLMAGFRPLLTVEGAGNLTGLREPAVFALNHNSSFECLAAPAALIWMRGRMLHFLIDWMFLHWPVLGWLMRRSDPVPVYGKRARWGLGERHRRARMCRPVVDVCLERLAAGGSLGIFPEGTRNRRADRLLRGRSGLGEIVLRSTVPVVPVGLRFPAAERLGRAPRLGRIVVVLGPPLDFREERARAAGLAAEARRTLAREVVDRVMSDIARLSGKSCAAGRPEPVPSRLVADRRAS